MLTSLGSCDLVKSTVKSILGFLFNSYIPKLEPKAPATWKYQSVKTETALWRRGKWQTGFFETSGYRNRRGRNQITGTQPEQVSDQVKARNLIFRMRLVLGPRACH